MIQCEKVDCPNEATLKLKTQKRVWNVCNDCRDDLCLAGIGVWYEDFTVLELNNIEHKLEQIIKIVGYMDEMLVNMETCSTVHLSTYDQLFIQWVDILSFHLQLIKHDTNG